jgi:hypothetical protein
MTFSVSPIPHLLLSCIVVGVSCKVECVWGHVLQWGNGNSAFARDFRHFSSLFRFRLKIVNKGHFGASVLFSFLHFLSPPGILVAYPS